MKYIGITLTPALTILLVGLILPLIMSARQKAEMRATEYKCVSYGRSAVVAMIVCSVVALLLTVAVLVCTIITTVSPEILYTSPDDTYGVVLVWVLSVALDVFTIWWSIAFTRKIYYNGTSITEKKPFKKKQTYLYTDITKIQNDTRIVLGEMTTRRGKLLIFIGEKRIKIPAVMFGVGGLIEMLRQRRPDLGE